MVRQGIVFGHLVSSKGFEVDKAMVEVIHDLALPKSIRDIRSFLGHVGFYHGTELMTNFSLISSNFPLEFRTSTRKNRSKFALIHEN